MESNKSAAKPATVGELLAHIHHFADSGNTENVEEINMEKVEANLSQTIQLQQKCSDLEKYFTAKYQNFEVDGISAEVRDVKLTKKGVRGARGHSARRRNRVTDAGKPYPTRCPPARPVSKCGTNESCTVVPVVLPQEGLEERHHKDR